MTVLENSGQLKKLKIIAYLDNNYKIPTGQVFFALINPENLTKQYTVSHSKHGPIGREQSKTNFKGVEPQKFNFEFILDGTGAVHEKIDVEEKIQEFLQTTYDYDKNIRKPKYLRIVWGNQILKCVLSNVSITYSLFNPYGKALRATINSEFIENISEELIQAAVNKATTEITNQRTVIAGDNLPSMTYEIYQSIDNMIEIAQHNQLNTLRQIPIASDLLFPPLK